MTQQGFHLIEILITLVIVFILTTMSLPIYSHYMVSTRRLAAKTALSTLSIAMERYHFLHDSYENATLEQLHLQNTANTQDYQLQIQRANQQTYQIAAIPQNNQAQKDQHCGALILNEKGERSITGSGTHEECW
ncbi:MAG: hypothetical protein A3F43_04865 [Gammaproteobacteria bacterium RIFCSPHIGHO2_12_FULL_42_10]|nr:MAG: hypothetical protein A3F43_04865 [Gammaproteobacteria bacterium RIFCSPHIGHO2_12_FULL_42_10]